MDHTHCKLYDLVALILSVDINFMAAERKYSKLYYYY